LTSAITLTLQLPAHFLDERPERAGFVLLGMFLLSFLFIRTSARLMRSPKVPWWPGSVVTDSGLHLHHLVFGIVLLLLSGFVGFVTAPGTPRTEILAALFGIGAGLTLDEFALWVHLRDVYWAEEGRSSFDAVVIAAVTGGLIVLGVAPFDLHNSTSSIETVALLVAIDVSLATVAILKGKRLLGLVGIFIPPLLLGGSLRLASPTSRWAQRFYAPGGRRLARADARWQRINSRRRRLGNAIAGAPSIPASADGAEPSEEARARVSE
jgi:hypothetical protein